MLMPLGLPCTLDTQREGVSFMMKNGLLEVSVLVSRHALEEIDRREHGNAYIERFNEYRRQFEEIANEKYAKGFVEQDGTVCIRSRDLPGHGH